MSEHIVVLGSGFAALTAIRTLRSARPDLDITVIAPLTTFTYLPSLIWIPTGKRQGAEITVDLQPLFKRLHVNFIQAHVVGLESNGRVVLTTAGSVNNTGLIIATGGRFLKNILGIEHTITLCEGVNAANSIRDRLRSLDRGRIAFGFSGNPKDPTAGRGGPMFEMVFGIDTWLRKNKKRDRIDLLFFNPKKNPGERLGERATSALLSQMKKKNIETHLGHKLLAFRKDGLETDGGFIPADLILFMPGMTGPDWISNTSLPISPGGFIEIDQYCAVPSMEKVFVAGDAGYYPGPEWLPKQAHMADLQAKAAAKNLISLLDGKNLTFIPRSELICVVDMLNEGILVYRDKQRAIILPPMKILSFAKHQFEKMYLSNLR